MEFLKRWCVFNGREEVEFRLASALIQTQLWRREGSLSLLVTEL
jgi:hypothetical protein